MLTCFSPDGFLRAAIIFIYLKFPISISLLGRGLNFGYFLRRMDRSIDQLGKNS